MRLGIIKSIFQKVDTLITGRGRIDDALLEELEAALLQADVNVHTTMAALDELREAVKENRLKDAEDVKALLRDSLASVFHRSGASTNTLHISPTPPTVILVVGVNGVGKTTSIAKLARLFKSQGRSVLLAAGDTFRAAAIDQLVVWAERVGVDIVRHREGGDPAAVLFDAVKAAKARGTEVVIADTAGRLHTKQNLMEELKKVNRVLEKELGRPADETLLVLDATTGQNGIQQARQFLQSVPLTGIILAKMDGTAKGGIVLTIADELGIPIKFVGTGESVDALHPFDPEPFVEALLA
jgi:fused signal recognition particle receptor